MTPFQQAICSLGETAESVSNNLRLNGIKGNRHSLCGCPISTYLHAKGFQGTRVNIFLDLDGLVGCAIWKDDPYMWDKYILEGICPNVVYLPAHVSQWIRDFDDGKYPEFIQECV
jgi:hypothetical protein